MKLSQTQAFDSPYLLSYASDFHSLQLVRDGAVHLTLGQSVEGPAEAFLSKLANPGFLFSAWPEIPRPAAREKGQPLADLALSPDRAALHR